MTSFKSILCFLVMVLAFGIVVLCGAPAVNAQDDKDKGGDAAKTEKEDDSADEEDEDKPNREDLASVRVLVQLARKIALDKVPGTILEDEIEKENGRLQWEIGIKTAEGKNFEVEIDAITGEVLEVEESTEENEKEDG